MISYNAVRKNKTLLQVLPLGSPVPATAAADLEKKEKPKESSSAGN